MCVCIYVLYIFIYYICYLYIADSAAIISRNDEKYKFRVEQSTSTAYSQHEINGNQALAIYVGY